MIEIHNLDHGGAIREIVDDAMTTKTLDTVTNAGSLASHEHVPAHHSLMRNIRWLRLAGICRSEK
jgi:hypothetical protein